MKEFNSFELQMFEDLSEAMFKHAEHKEWSIENLSNIVVKRHIENGFFSYDGMFEDICALLNDEVLGKKVFLEL